MGAMMPTGNGAATETGVAVAAGFAPRKTNNLAFIWLLIKLRLSHMMVFRFSFFEGFFADGVLFVVQILAFNAIYGHVDGIGDWGRGQMIVFVGTFSLLNAISMTVCFFGLVGLPQKIREGGLDLYVTKPGSALLRLTFERVDPGSAPLIVFSCAIVLYGARVAGIRVTPALAAAYAALALLMALLYYDMELILRTVPFFTLSASALDRLEGNLLTLNFQIPGTLYRGAFKAVFLFALPYGVMATAPAQLLCGALTPLGLLHALAIAAAFTAFALRFWRFGLRHYKSASS